MFIKTGIAVMLVVSAASQAATQDLPVGSRVRITTTLGFHYQGELTRLDSAAFTVSPDDSTPGTRIPRSDVKRLEKSTGVERVREYPGWVEAATWAGLAGGAWYGATGWGHNEHPRGVVGGVLGFFAGGIIVDLCLRGFGHEAMEEQWKRVDLTPTIQPVVTSDATGRILVGLSFSLR